MIDVEQVVRPALDAYSAALDAHGFEAMTQIEHPLRSGMSVPRWVGRCRCGWESKPNRRPQARRALSLHQTAARKRADRQYDIESSALLLKAAQDAEWANRRTS